MIPLWSGWSYLDKKVSHTPPPPLSFHFCLRFPQYLYDIDTKTETPFVSNIIATVRTSSGGVSQSLANSFQTAAGTPPSSPQSSNPTNPTASPSSLSSPAMIFLTSSSKKVNLKRNIIEDYLFWIVRQILI